MQLLASVQLHVHCRHGSHGLTCLSDQLVQPHACMQLIAHATSLLSGWLRAATRPVLPNRECGLLGYRVDTQHVNAAAFCMRFIAHRCLS